MNILPFYGLDDLSEVFSESENLPYESFSSRLFSIQSVTYCSHDTFGQNELLDEQFLCDIESSLPECDYMDGNAFSSLKIRPKFSIVSCNINSISSNFDKFYSSYLNDNDFVPSVLAFSETRLGSDFEHLFCIPHYKTIFNSRNTKGGGLLLAVDSNFNFTKMGEFCFMYEYIESLFIEIKINDENIILGLIYRPPNSSYELFLEKYRFILECLGNRKSYLFGDYNIDLLKYNDRSRVKFFVDMSMEFSYIPLINKPTRISTHSATLIDHIWTNNINENVNSAILMNDCSDHFAPFIWLSSPSLGNGEKAENFTYRNFRNLENEEAHYYLSQKLDNFKNFIGSDSERNFLDLTCIISDVLDKFCPQKKITKVTNRNKPWISENLKILIKEKNKLHKKYVLRPLSFGDSYRALRNHTNNCIKVEKKRYYQNLLNKYKNNSKKTWSVLNELLGRRAGANEGAILEVNGEETEDGEVIAREFNKYFSTVTDDIVSSIHPSIHSYRHYLLGNYQTSFELSPMSSSEIELIIKNLNDTDGGYQKIPTKVFKIFSSIISEPLSIIFNICIADGYFPNSLKISKIVPIYKSKSKLLVENYRPISLLPIISKFFEKYIYQHLSSYVEINNILCDQQAGFRKKSSTNISIAKFLDKVISGVDEGVFGLGVFLDFRKAFDMVDHDILLDKMFHYGIRGTPLKLFKSYLSGRKQYVHINDFSSNLSNLFRGVPQGSTLSALIFLLFINDIVHSSNILFFNLFADDTSIYLKDSVLSNLYSVMNRELIKVGDWISVNKLSLNIDKTIYLQIVGK